jgi:hypothetical protein
MRDDSLLAVLDEPTSAADPLAEAQLLGRYAEAASSIGADSRSVMVMVSHRFSTVRMADLIVVLDGGRVAESGPHDELVRAGGLYAELFALQARPYAASAGAGAQEEGGDAVNAGLSTAAAAAVVASSVAEARQLNAAVIGQEHLLLAISALPDSLAARALAATTGTDATEFRATLLGLLRPAPAAPPNPPGPTPRTVAALQQAALEAAEHGRPATTADVVLGILRTREGAGYQLLSGGGVAIDGLRDAVAALVGSDAELEETSPLALVAALEAAG